MPTGAPPTIDELAGLTFNGLNYAADMAMFDFGPQHLRIIHFGPRKGQTLMVGSHSLHVQCPWRLSGSAGTVLANQHTPAKALDHLVGKVVSEPVLDRAAGSLRMTLAHDYRLDVTTDGEDHEQWRLLKGNDPEADHLVWGDDDVPS